MYSTFATSSASAACWTSRLNTSSWIRSPSSFPPFACPANMLVVTANLKLKIKYYPCSRGLTGKIIKNAGCLQNVCLQYAIHITHVSIVPDRIFSWKHFSMHIENNIFMRDYCNIKNISMGLSIIARDPQIFFVQFLISSRNIGENNIYSHRE